MWISQLKDIGLDTPKKLRSHIASGCTDGAPLAASSDLKFASTAFPHKNIKTRADIPHATPILNDGENRCELC